MAARSLDDIRARSQYIVPNSGADSDIEIDDESFLLEGLDSDDDVLDPDFILDLQDEDNLTPSASSKQSIMI